MYFPLAHELVEQGNRVIVHDLAGIGQHDGVAIKKYSLDDYVADFFELINATGGGPVGVIGQSFGTTITIRSLAQSPEQFRAAALLGGFAKRQLTAVERSLARCFTIGRDTLRTHRFTEPLPSIISSVNSTIVLPTALSISLLARTRICRSASRFGKHLRLIRPISERCYPRLKRPCWSCMERKIDRCRSPRPANCKTVFAIAES